MPRARNQDVALHCTQMGLGPDVVLVHGLATNQAFWYFHLAPAFAQQHRLTLYDLRGHGRSGIPPAGYTTRDQAGDLLAVMDHFQMANADLVAHSFGAAVSLHFAALHPERVRTLTLMDCRLHALQPFGSEDDQAYWDQQKSGAVARGFHIPPGTPKWLLPMLEELEGVVAAEKPAGLPGLMARERAWNPQGRSAQRWLRLVTATTFVNDLRQEAGLSTRVIKGVRHPCLLLYGEKSLLMPTGRQLDELLPNRRTFILPGVGHFFPLVRPDLVIDNVLPFLSQHRTGK